MPADNIKKAVQKGTGELPGVTYDEVTYEAYGPGGVAILIQVMTDNKNRSVAEIRHILSKQNGNMGEVDQSAGYLINRVSFRSMLRELMKIP